MRLRGPARKKEYKLNREWNTSLDFSKPGPDRYLPAPVELGQYKVIFTRAVFGGYTANVFENGRLLGQTSVSRWKENRVPLDGDSYLVLKLSLLDLGHLNVSKITYD
jgi:hypothetical protein